MRYIIIYQKHFGIGKARDYYKQLNSQSKTEGKNKSLLAHSADVWIIAAIWVPS